MRYFLAKTDPETYSIDQLEREKKTVWDGVTNPQAVRAIREMRPDDRVFVYHSGGESAILGLAAVRSAPRDDPKNPKSAVVDLGRIKLWGAPAWWLWGLVHVGLLVGVRNRISTMVNWFWSYLTFRSAIRLITGAEPAGTDSGNPDPGRAVPC